LALATGTSQKGCRGREDQRKKAKYGNLPANCRQFCRAVKKRGEKA